MTGEGVRGGVREGARCMQREGGREGAVCMCGVCARDPRNTSLDGNQTKAPREEGKVRAGGLLALTSRSRAAAAAFR